MKNSFFLFGFKELHFFIIEKIVLKDFFKSVIMNDRASISDTTFIFFYLVFKKRKNKQWLVSYYRVISFITIEIKKHEERLNFEIY